MPIEKWRAKGNMYVNRKGAVRGAERHSRGRRGRALFVVCSVKYVVKSAIGRPAGARAREQRVLKSVRTNAKRQLMPIHHDKAAVSQVSSMRLF